MKITYQIDYYKPELVKERLVRYEKKGEFKVFELGERSFDGISYFGEKEYLESVKEYTLDYFLIPKEIRISAISKEGKFIK